MRISLLMVFASTVITIIASTLLFLVLIKLKKHPFLGQLVFVLEILLHCRQMFHFTYEAAEQEGVNVHV